MNFKKGFSLVELLVVVSIMAILMMGAISSFKFYYKTFAETRLINLQKLIDFSVIQARINGENVIVCAATMPTEGDPGGGSFTSAGKLDETKLACTNSKDWSDNPIVSFISSDGSANFVKETDKVIANLAKGNNSSLYVSMSFGETSLKISPDGFMATGNGNIVYCSRDGEYQSALIINMVGRVIYTDEPTKDNGDAYTCSA